MTRTLLARRLRRSRSAVVLLVTLAVVLAGGLDWYVRNDSLGRFLVVAEEVDATLTPFAEHAGTFARSVQEGAPNNGATGDFRRHSIDVHGVVAEQCASLPRTALLPWHTALRTARDAFLTHCLAWLGFLSLLIADWRNLFTSPVNITTSFEAAKNAAEEAVPPLPLHQVRQRVRRVFAD